MLALHEPAGPGVRVDSGIARGTLVGSDYDPMLSKVIAWGTDRDEALRRLDTALGATTVLGLDTNVGFLRGLLADDDVRAGDLDTGLVGRRLADLATTELPADVLTAVMGQALLRLEPGTAVVDPFDVPGGWRVGEHAWTMRRLVVAGHEPVEVRARGRAGDAEIVVGSAEPVATSTSGFADGLTHTRDGRSRRYAVGTGADGVVWIARDGSAWGVREQEPLEAARTATDDGGGPVVSPMPGTVTVVEVADGDQVTAGQTLVVVEAMKMEHVLTAPVDGTVRELRARTGGTVARGDVLVTVEPASESSERGTSISTAEGSG